jgi:hypothetical protein
LLDPPKFGRGPTGEVWRLEENLAPLLGDCRRLLDGESRFLVLTVYAVRMSALAIGELVTQTLADLGGTVEMGEMAVREEARGLLLLPLAVPLLIFGAADALLLEAAVSLLLTAGAPFVAGAAIRAART